jgi:hypothetical protein
VGGEGGTLFATLVLGFVHNLVVVAFCPMEQLSPPFFFMISLHLLVNFLVLEEQATLDRAICNIVHTFIFIFIFIYK